MVSGKCPPVKVRVSFRVGGQFSSGAIVLEPFFMYQLKKFFITTKQTLIKDVIKHWNMEWLAERIEIK